MTFYKEYDSTGKLAYLTRSRNGLERYQTLNIKEIPLSPQFYSCTLLAHYEEITEKEYNTLLVQYKLAQ